MEQTLLPFHHGKGPFGLIPVMAGGILQQLFSP